MLYEIHDNGGRPFEATVSANHIQVKRQTDGAIVFDSEHERVLVGGRDGNSLLVQLNHDTFVWIGWKIVRFTLHEGAEGIVKYKSPIGNSDVPYPYAITDDGAVYLFLQEIYTFDVDPQSSNPYGVYYRSENVATHPFVNYEVLCDRDM